MLTIITTALRWTPELEASIRSTEKPEVRQHVICLAESLPGVPEYGGGGKRAVHIRTVPGCGIARGFNECLKDVPEDDCVLVLNEGDSFLGAAELLQAREEHPEWDGAIGTWKVAGRVHAPKRTITRAHLVRHGLGFSHSAMVIRAAFHRRFGHYPEDYAICMDYALILAAVLRGARFEMISTLVVEIEPPGVSARIWPTTAEHRRAARQAAGAVTAWLMWSKWIANSLVARGAARWLK